MASDNSPFSLREDSRHGVEDQNYLSIEETDSDGATESLKTTQGNGHMRRKVYIGLFTVIAILSGLAGFEYHRHQVLLEGEDSALPSDALRQKMNGLPEIEQEGNLMDHENEMPSDLEEQVEQPRENEVVNEEEQVEQPRENENEVVNEQESQEKEDEVDLQEPQEVAMPLHTCSVNTNLNSMELQATGPCQCGESVIMCSSGSYQQCCTAAGQCGQRLQGNCVPTEHCNSMCNQIFQEYEEKLLKQEMEEAKRQEEALKRESEGFEELDQEEAFHHYPAPTEDCPTQCNNYTYSDDDMMYKPGHHLNSAFGTNEGDFNITSCSCGRSIITCSHGNQKQCCTITGSCGRWYSGSCHAVSSSECNEVCGGKPVKSKCDRNDGDDYNFKEGKESKDDYKYIEWEQKDTTERKKKSQKIACRNESHDAQRYP